MINVYVFCKKYNIISSIKTDFSKENINWRMIMALISCANYW